MYIKAIITEEVWKCGEKASVSIKSIQYLVRKSVIRNRSSIQLSSRVGDKNTAKLWVKRPLGCTITNVQNAYFETKLNQ